MLPKLKLPSDPRNASRKMPLTLAKAETFVGWGELEKSAAVEDVSAVDVMKMVSPRNT